MYNFYGSSQCRWGQFEISLVTDHNQLQFSDGFLTSFVMPLYYGYKYAINKCLIGECYWHGTQQSEHHFKIIIIQKNVIMLFEALKVLYTTKGGNLLNHYTQWEMLFLVQKLGVFSGNVCVNT